ncbi:hypothetical protein R75777_04175 [Paraburkholderia nemoris]|nr:hypothetical protein R75777_04175 [Paraburkholderia nemoris]
MSALQVGLRRADADASTSHRKHWLETDQRAPYSVIASLNGHRCSLGPLAGQAQKLGHFLMADVHRDGSLTSANCQNCFI